MLDLFAGQQFQPLVFGKDHHTVAFDIGALGGVIERHQRNVFRLDVTPDVHFGPVGEREGAHAFALADHAVVDVPQFRALVARVPFMVGRAEGIDAFLGAARLLIAARAAEGCIELAGIERLAQRFGLHDVGVKRRTVGEGRYVFARTARVGVGNQVEIVFLDDIVAEFDHFLELPAGIDVQQREGNAAGEKRLAREMQQHG